MEEKIDESTLCCCGHTYAVHIGGWRMTEQKMLTALPDGGMCRAIKDGGRCSCFNFCTCYSIVA
jgi:hypothetical protein